MRYAASLFFVLLGLLLVSCSRPMRALDLPPPDHACQSADAATWNDLIPGESNQADVVRVLGQPILSDTQRFTWPSVWESPYYAYPVPSGTLVGSEFGHYKIYFRPDGTIDWMELPIGDVDGRYHALRQYTDALGNQVDGAYLGGRGHVFGPDAVVVWAECGVALVVLYTCSSGVEDYSVPCHPLLPTDPVATNAEFTTTIAAENLGHPRLPNGERASVGNHDEWSSAVLLKLVFPPTTYKAYGDYFSPVVPSARYYYMGIEELPSN